MKYINTKSGISIILLLLLSYATLFAQNPGQLDTSFNPGTGPNGAVFAIERQPDGKIIIGGDFTSYNGVSRRRLARLNPDGSLDASFMAGTGAGPGDTVYDIAVQPDGKIVIVGDFYHFSTSPGSVVHSGITRLNSDGTLDATFNPNNGIGKGVDLYWGSPHVYTVVLRPDGNILIGGEFDSYNGTTVNDIALIGPNGDIQSFSGISSSYDVRAIALQPDGKIMVTGHYVYSKNINRLYSAGGIDTSFASGNGLYQGTSSQGIYGGAGLCMILLPNEKILVGGSFNFANGIVRQNIVRLNSNGSVDTAFNAGTIFTHHVDAMALQQDGKIILIQTLSSVNNIFRINADGSQDTTFNPGTGASHINDVLIQPDGKILIAGNFTSYNGTPIFRIARIHGDAINCAPEAPTAQDQVFCTISNPTVASLTAEGTNLKWYSTATGDTALEADEEVTAGTYYVSQSNGACESARTAVEVTLADNCITLEEPFCNITAPFTKPLYAEYVPGATLYRFRVQEGSNIQVIERNVRYFYVNNIDGYNYDKQYSVSVSYLKDSQWSAYGPACSISTPAPAQSQLKPEYCGIAVSSFATAIYATSAPMTTGYRFRIMEGGNTQVIEKTVGYFKVNEITGHTYGKTYTIDVAIRINGEWGTYGPDCTVTTSQAVAQLADAYCGITTTNLRMVIYAKGVSQATGYRFRINDGTTDHVLTRTQRYFLVSQIPGYTYSTTYTVNVAALINGSWTDYGPACNITTPAAPLTQLVAAQCGATIPSLATNIRIGAVSRVQGYRLRITDGLQEQILDRPSASFRLNMLASRQYNVTYTVEVAVLVNGGYGSYGPACTITAVSNTSRPGNDDVASEAETEVLSPAANVTEAITLTSYPNPYTESFTIEMNTPSQEKVTVRIFDMNGRLVEDITVSPEELTSQKLGGRYAAGVYNVIVAQGDYMKAFKVVKK